MLASNHLVHFTQWCNTNCANIEIVFTRCTTQFTWRSSQFDDES